MPSTPPRLPPRMERRSASPFIPINTRDEERSPSEHFKTPEHKIRSILSPQSSASSSPGEARAASRSSSPILSDAFDDRTIRNHLGNYEGMRIPGKNETPSQAKAKHAYRDAQKTFADRGKGAHPPKVNSKVYLSKARERQVAADYDRLIKNGDIEGRIQTRGRLVEAGKMLGNPKKSSLELHFTQRENPIGNPLVNPQDPRMGHLAGARRIPSIRRQDSSESDTDESPPQPNPKARQKKK